MYLGFHKICVRACKCCKDSRKRAVSRHAGSRNIDSGSAYIHNARIKIGTKMSVVHGGDRGGSVLNGGSQAQDVTGALLRDAASAARFSAPVHHPPAGTGAFPYNP